MSNLKLPRMDYETLRALCLRSTARTSRLGYETRAYLSDNVAEMVTVTHHGSVIAELSPRTVTLTTAGWNSSTTTARLHRIMVDSGIWPRYGVAIRQGATRVIVPGQRETVLANSFQGFESFTLTSAGWVRA